MIYAILIAWMLNGVAIVRIAHNLKHARPIRRRGWQVRNFTMNKLGELVCAPEATNETKLMALSIAFELGMRAQATKVLARDMFDQAQIPKEKEKT